MKPSNPDRYTCTRKSNGDFSLQLRPALPTTDARKPVKDAVTAAIQTPKVDTGKRFTGVDEIVASAAECVASSEHMLQQLARDPLQAGNVLSAEAVEAISHGKRWLDSLRKLRDAARPTTDESDFLSRSRAATTSAIAKIREGAAALWNGKAADTATPAPRTVVEQCQAINEANRKFWAGRQS